MSRGRTATLRDRHHQGGRRSGRWRYDYVPTPKQAIAHRAYADELLFGGAAGPGKTDWLLAENIAHCLELPGANAVIFRRTYPELSRPSGIIHRLLTRIPPSVGTYNASDHVWTFRNGSTLLLSHLQRDTDVTAHQGAEYTLVSWDELTQFTEFQYLYLQSRLRVAGDLRDRMEAMGLRPRTIATTNPGGIGHVWVKARFIDPAPAGRPFRPAPTTEEPQPGTRVFIPALLEDNPHVDEGYRRRLERLPEDERRALLLGDWDVFAGQRFGMFQRDTHVIDPEDLRIPLGGVPRALGIDYGMAAPFVALWGAKLPGDVIVVYRETTGVNLSPREQAERILELEARGERRRGMPAALDPATWARNPRMPKSAPEKAGLPPRGSIARDYHEAGVPVTPAYNDRLAGAKAVADHLTVRHAGHDDGEDCGSACGPRLLIYSTCRYLIRTLPALVRDDRNPEDVDTDGDDHAYDALRYLLAQLGQAPAQRTADERAARKRAERTPRSAGHTVTGDLQTGGW